MKHRVDELLQKDMSRREFLGAVGLGLVSVFGFSSVLKFLLENNGSRTTLQKLDNPTVKSTGTIGYGNTPYGR
ncbi:hypothetical protein KC867_02360 [Candidatus Saccharibacteria bacterium]|nr:hypothetical protein [Candidatus Saccharibacteria bacterium]